MRAEDLLELLGHSAEQPEIAAMLSEFGIRSRPSLQDAPPDEQSWHDWLVNGALGIEFGFQDQADYRAQNPHLRGKGPLLLTQICFYRQHAGIQPYNGPLPFGLLPSDDKSAVQRKLLTTGISPRSYTRDVWDLPKFRLIVAYDAGNSRIASVLCLLPMRPWPSDADESVGRPSLVQLVALLDQPISSPQLLATLTPLQLESFGVDRTRIGHWRLRHAHGLDLSFIEPADARAPEPVLGSIRFFRDREWDAYGWKGDLPRGIRFDDSQMILFDKVARAPVVSIDRDLQGFAVWHYPEFTLHVLYSNVHNYLLRVTLLKPGLWDAAEDEE
jgi:hypothetical protein